MEKLPYLNVGCGNKFHKSWVNVDMVSGSPYVKAYNLLKGIPFPDNTFDVVYHSQVLEHFRKEDAPAFIKECCRVLKPGGIIRVVVPDLENIVDEYRKHLNKNLENPDMLSEANYDWIVLEMYDQTVRHYGGGQMADVIRQPALVNEQYILDRIGHVGRTLRKEAFVPPKTFVDKVKGVLADKNKLKRAPKTVFKKLRYLLGSESYRIGAFRLDGEIHMWMYDRYSLARLLQQCGLENPQQKTPAESDIPKWSEYELDVKDGMIFDPTSLFMEARKAVSKNV